MWLLIWKKYKLSKLATFISIIGALMRYAAVLCIAYSAIAGFFVCGVIGVGLHFLAESIGKKKWKNMVVNKGFTAKIAAGDLEAAIAVYNSNPATSTLNFIASYNAQLAEEVKSRIQK